MENQRFHNALGEEYDLLKLAYPHYDRLQDEIGKAIADHYKNSNSSTITVLELGCGTGITTDALLRCDSRTRITALDGEEKMIVQARENVKNWKAEDRVTIIQTEIGKFLNETGDASFDVVASGFVLHNIENSIREKIIAEIYRVLKPGGIFVNGDKYACDDLALRKKIYDEQIARYDVYDTIGRSDYKKEWLAHMDRDEKEDLLFIEGPAKDYMKHLGFKNVTTSYREFMEAVVVGEKI